MQTWYIETSAVNYLQSHHVGPDGIGTLATRALQEEKGRRWCISPVTIWEIIQTSNDSRREELIDFSQHIFSRELLVSPEDLIIEFITQGMPLKEPRRDLVSSSELGNVWTDIVDNPRKTLQFDKSVVRDRANFLKSFSKNIHLIDRDKDKLVLSESLHAHLDVTLASLVETASAHAGRGPLDESSLRFHKIVMFYITTILCAGMGFDNESVERFWSKIGIDETTDRFMYVVTKLPDILFRGPFVLMGYMTQAQLRSGFSRGLWFDCLHSVYLSYVEFFITSDGHFKELREDLDHPRFNNVLLHTDEIDLYSVRKDWLGRST